MINGMLLLVYFSFLSYFFHFCSYTCTLWSCFDSEAQHRRRSSSIANFMCHHVLMLSSTCNFALNSLRRICFGSVLRYLKATTNLHTIQILLTHTAWFLQYVLLFMWAVLAWERSSWDRNVVCFGLKQLKGVSVQAVFSFLSILQ